jgi:predicted amidohydrolase YtcJ
MMKNFEPTLWFNAAVVTMDPMLPRSNAVLVKGGRVEAVGQTALALAGDGVARVDLGGACLVPGFTESHIHYFDWSLALKRLMLDGARSLGELLDAVAAEAARPDRSWALGFGWYEGGWPDVTDRPLPFPTRQDLDAVCPRKPVVLWRADLHLAVANSAALEAAGIDRFTPDPPMGRIDRDPSGDPSGVLRDWAINPVRKLALASLCEAEIDAAFVDAQSELHRFGITGVHDLRLMGGIEAGTAFAAWQRLRHSGRMRLRTWCCMAGEDLEACVRLGLRTGLGDAWLRVGHFKVYADGSMGAHTAWVIDPYATQRDASGYGLPMFSMKEIGRLLQAGRASGNALTMHAIGDRAVLHLAQLLSAAESRPRTAGFAPDRIEHLQMVRPDAMALLANLSPGSVAISAQPMHLLLDKEMIDLEFGALGRYTYPFATILAAGLPLAFGSDCPVTHFDPLQGMHAAVTRSFPGYEADPWHTGERISAAQALRAYTSGPATACGLQQEQGTIAPGMLADFTVLSADPLTVSPAELPRLRVLMTVVGGETVFTASNATAAIDALKRQAEK